MIDPATHWFLLCLTLLTLVVGFCFIGFSDWQLARGTYFKAVAQQSFAQGAAGLFLIVDGIITAWLGYACRTGESTCREWLTEVLILDRYLLVVAFICLWIGRNLSFRPTKRKEN